MNKPDRNSNAVYKTVSQIMKETNLCRNSVMRIAAEADSLIRIGRAVRINSLKFYNYMETEYRADE